MPRSFPTFFIQRYQELIRKHFNEDVKFMDRFQIWFKRINFYSIDGKSINYELVLPLSRSTRIVVVVKKRDLRYLYLVLGNYQKALKKKLYIDALKMLDRAIKYAKEHSVKIYKEYTLDSEKVARLEL